MVLPSAGKRTERVPCYGTTRRVFLSPYPEVSIGRIYRVLDPAAKRILQQARQHAEGSVVRVRDVVLAIEHLEPEVALCLLDHSTGVMLWPSYSFA